MEQLLLGQGASQSPPPPPAPIMNKYQVHSKEIKLISVAKIPIDNVHHTATANAVHCNATPPFTSWVSLVLCFEDSLLLPPGLSGECTFPPPPIHCSQMLSDGVCQPTRRKCVSLSQTRSNVTLHSCPGILGFKYFRERLKNGTCERLSGPNARTDCHKRPPVTESLFNLLTRMSSAK